jgi:beta-N-acetylhexosaminidase
MIRFGSNMALGAITDIDRAEKLAYECGRYNAILAVAAGINWSFGPVVDLPLNYDNPMVGTRAYGNDPEKIVRLASAFFRGMQAHGMACTLKHFPGDGTDDRDQHLVTPVNDLEFDEWLQTYGRTFGGCIRNGVYSVMVGHIALLCKSARDPRTGTLMPATLDSKIQVDLLRKQLGFEGVVISDAIAMGGAVSHCRNTVETSIRNIISGSDMVLFVTEMKKVVSGIKEALLRKEITEERLRESVRRILTMKARLGIMESEPEPLFPETEKYENGRAASIATEIAESSLTLVRDFNHALPLRLKPGARIVICLLPREVADGEGIMLPDQVSKEFEATHLPKELERRGFKTVCVASRSALDTAMAEAAPDALIYISTTNPEAGRGSIRLSRLAYRCVNFRWDVLNSEIPALFISMGNPAVLRELPDLPNFICTYARSEAIAAALTKALFGELEFKGALPVEIPLFT